MHIKRVLKFLRFYINFCKLKQFFFPANSVLPSFYLIFKAICDISYFKSFYFRQSYYIPYFSPAPGPTVTSPTQKKLRGKDNNVLLNVDSTSTIMYIFTY